MSALPILWTFRRCPYAMRARLAIQSARLKVDLREILLRDKPALFLETSPKGSVPVVNTGTTVIEESRDIMLWALGQNDPDGWLDMPLDGLALIDACDGPFKTALDHTKYAVRYPNLDATAERTKAAMYLHGLNDRLSKSTYLMDATLKLADIAIVTFVRQFANIDRVWFDTQPWPHLIRWLDQFLASAAFTGIMTKYPTWQEGHDTLFLP